MRIGRTGVTVVLLLLALFVLPDMTYAGNNDHSKPMTSSKNSRKSKPKNKNGLKSYESLIEDMVKIEGLFTFYKDTTDNSVLMSINPDQFDTTYLCGMTITRGDGAFVEGQRMLGTFPWYFKRVGTDIQMLERNLRIRSDSTSVMRKAIEAGISDGLWGSTAVKSLPQDSTEAILIDPSSFFVTDALNLGYYIGQMGKTGVSFDSKNSNFGDIKSFPENSEIKVILHYHTGRPQRADALQNPYSFFHTVNFSLSSIPESDYTPRVADDRVGHFMTLYQDFSGLDSESPYVHYIQRWNLKKKNPNARVSEPVKPIVYWVENTVPEEYRDAVAEGIEFWNGAFEKIGFRNAIVAKQMPDTADWDPADVRYSTVRWLVASNYPYVAIGPHRSNPYTGEVYDADIGFVSEAIRSLFHRYEREVSPIVGKPEAYDEYSFTPSMDQPEPPDPFDHLSNNYETCQIFDGIKDAVSGLAYLSSAGDFKDKDSLTKEFIHSFIVFVIAHEVGHTLGFKHNFIASSIYGLDQLQDKEFTRENGMVSTVMDYTAPNVADHGKPQGEFYSSTPGPYDKWIIEYSYSDFGDITPEEEAEKLKAIADKASDPKLAYATDEDTYGYSVKSLDPRTNIWDLGKDPIAFIEREFKHSLAIWNGLISEFEQPGDRYQRVRNAFNSSFRPYSLGSRMLPKYIGGLYHERLHVGDRGGTLPYKVVPAAEQRRAMQTLARYLFSADAFKMPPSLVNKLQEENLADFNYSQFRRPTVDYPLHQKILTYQNLSLQALYSPYLLGRLVNNLARVPDGEEKFTMHDMFSTLRNAIWSEASEGKNVNSFRRNLQLLHLSYLTRLYLAPAAGNPADARTMAANDLIAIQNAVKSAVDKSGLDAMSKAHYEEILRQIEATQEARRIRFNL